MMIQKFLLPIAFGAALVGCTGSGESNEDPKLSTTTVARDPSQLPPDMPPEARKAAEAAMAQQAAMNAQMDAQAAAMKKAQGGGN